MLEECGLPYAVHPVNLADGEQTGEAFLKISPNGRIPAIVDHDGPDNRPIQLFESGAILIYLTGKTGRFLPRSDRERYLMLQWLMWQMAGIGPMFGQYWHFVSSAPDKQSYGRERYGDETRRLLNVLDTQLARTKAFVSGRQYTITDMAVYPWICAAQKMSVDLADYPQVQRWLDAVGGRPAVRRAMDVLVDYKRRNT